MQKKKTYSKRFLLTAMSAAFICTASSAGTASATTSNIFNVTSYGAKGDGTTDDTSAIQAAMTAAGSVGGTVYFPKGTYLFSSTLTGTNVNLLGQGPQNSILEATANVSVSLSGSAGSVVDLGFQSQVSNTTGLSLSGMNAANVSGAIFGMNYNTALSISSCQSVLVDLTAVNMAATGISVTNNHNVRVKRSIVSGTGQNTGIYSNNNTNVIIAQNRVVYAKYAIVTSSDRRIDVRGNEALDYTNFAVEALSDWSVQIWNNRCTTNQQSSVAIYPASCTTCVANGNAIRGGSIGVESVHNTNSTVFRNTVENCTQGVYMSADTNPTVFGNRISTQQTSGIYVLGGTGSINVTRNKIDNVGLTGASAVIQVSAAGATAISITDNFYTGNSQNLNYFISCTNPATVSGNQTNTGLPNNLAP